MDATQLAVLMLKWEWARRELDELEAAIRDSVLELGKTETVGNVRASYSTGRKKYDYQTAVEATDPHPEWLDVFQSIATDWRNAYKSLAADEGLDIADVPFTQGAPSVSIKLIK